jgi:DNA-binding GntR family transcriptional regulator
VIVVSIDHEAEQPIYQQVAALLRARIEAGEITRRMPSLKSVEQEFGVSHGSVEKAFGLLRSEGLIRPVIGRGYYVIPAAERG